MPARPTPPPDDGRRRPGGLGDALALAGHPPVRRRSRPARRRPRPHAAPPAARLP